MIDEENVMKFAQDHDVPFSNFESLCKSKEIIDLIQLEVNQVNKKFANVEQVKKFTLIDVQLTAEDDELTPTMKLKRKFINLCKPFFLKRYKIAAIMNELIISGIDLMLTGMVTVLIFLSILIILINISAAIFKDGLTENIDGNKNTSNSVGKISNNHKEIINIINKRIFNE